MEQKETILKSIADEMGMCLIAYTALTSHNFITSAVWLLTVQRLLYHYTAVCSYINAIKQVKFVLDDLYIAFSQVILMQMKFVLSPNGLYFASKFAVYCNKQIVQPKMKIICSQSQGTLSFQSFKKGWKSTMKAVHTSTLSVLDSYYSLVWRRPKFKPLFTDC